jgi:stalled ribosome rescue protein Dom34
MSYMALWIDHDDARIFNFKEQEPEVSHLPNRHHVNHHNTRHQENEKQEQLKMFFHEVHDKILSAKGILILGPGFAKNEFKAYLEAHHPKGLGKSILELQPMDKATDNEIKEKARKFFHQYNLFQSIG